jgi:hypothetical protein
MHGRAQPDKGGIGIAVILIMAFYARFSSPPHWATVFTHLFSQYISIRYKHFNRHGRDKPGHDGTIDHSFDLITKKDV